jgi:hypothetical protein
MPQQDSKTLSFRISISLWIRIGDAARRRGLTTRAFCTQVIEEYLDTFAGKPVDDVNGPPVRKVIDKLKKSPQEGA